MANYSTLKAAVQNVVKTNGTRAITGANLQSVLLSIINSIGGGGYIFKGVATPSTNAGTPDENVFYIGGAGTYANFGASVTVPVGSICVFKYNGSWAKEQITLFAGIDDAPTMNSNNLVKSDGIYRGIGEINTDIGRKIQFEGGAVNYLTGYNTPDPRAIRCGHIYVTSDVNIHFQSDRIVYVAYIVKYLDGVYAGYSQISYIESKEFNYSLTKDSTFNSIRIRVSLSEDSSVPVWSDADIASASAVVYSSSGIYNAVSNIESQLSDFSSSELNKTYTFWSNRFANMQNIAVGSTYSLFMTTYNGFGCCILKCNAGDKFKIKTAGNTAGAKAYAFFDRNLVCLSFQQAAITGELTAPSSAAYLIVNSSTQSEYYLTKILGNVSTQKDVKNSLYNFEYYNFTAIGINYLNGSSVNPTDGKTIATSLISISNDVIINIDTPRTLQAIFIVKFLNGVYAGYELYRNKIAYNAYDNNGTMLPVLLEKDDTFNEVVIRIDVASTQPVFTADEIEASFVSIYSSQPFRDLIGKIIDYKRYKINNYDNSFQFDYLTSMLLKAEMVSLYPNFNIPKDGAYISTDIDYVGMREEPLTDEQITKSSVPYLYINGEKRGTIVLYDTDGTPFIYDKNGNKITLQ